MAKVQWKGHTFDSRTVAQLKAAEKLSGIPFDVVQGSYANGSLSAGTHSGPGAVDLSVNGLSRAEIERVVKSLRTVGIAAWYRDSSEGPWSPHIHGISIGAPGLPSAAQRQVTAYKNGRSGLASNRADRHAYMKVPFRTWEQYLKTVIPPNNVTIANVKRGKTNADVKKTQSALRKYLWENGVNPNKLNPNGVTGYFGSETANMINHIHGRLAKQTGDSGWLKASYNELNPTLARRLGLAPR